MTQIRVGVASAIVLLSITSIEEKNFKLFLLQISIACLFHYSVLIIIPFYFLRNDKISKIYYFLIPIAYLFYYLQINLLSILKYITFSPIIQKYNTYLYLANIDTLNVFSAWHLLRCVFCLFLLWNWEYFLSKNKYAVLLLKYYVLSFFFFIAFANIPAFASRVSDLFAIVEFILTPFLFYFFKNENKILGSISIFVIGLFMLCTSLFYIKFLKLYF